MRWEQHTSPGESDELVRRAAAGDALALGIRVERWAESGTSLICLIQHVESSVRMKDLTDHELLLIAKRDPAALDRLVVRHYDRLLKVIQARLPMWMERHVSVEDVAQETLARVFASFGEFEPRGPDSFFHWVRRIAENQVHNMVDFYRAKKRGGDRPEISLDAASSQTAVAVLWQFARGQKTPSEVAANAEKVRQLADCIQKLDPDHQRVLHLRFTEGLPVQSIARVMNRSEDAAQALLFRATLRLRRLFPKSKP